jgi:HEAT repeat protein
MRTPLLTLLALLLTVPAFAWDDADGADLLLEAWDLEPTAYATARGILVHDPSLPDDLLEALAETHPDVRVRTQAAIVLGWRADPELFGAVWAARSILDRRGVRERFVDDVFADAAAQPAVVERILHSRESSRTLAGLAMAMVRVGDDWSARMVAILADTDDAGVREMAAWTLRHAEPEFAHVGLALGLTDGEPRVRAEAARSVGFRADGGALSDDLVVALGDANPAVRAAAARSLGFLRVASAAGSLEVVIADADPEVRLHALRALDRVDPIASKALPGLDRLAQDPDPKVARVAQRIRRR